MKPASAVDFRPLGMDLGRPASTADGGIVFRVPAPVAESHGLQFSVEGGVAVISWLSWI